MKRQVTIAAAILCLISVSCVSTKKYNALETRNSKLKKEHAVAISELEGLKDEKNNLLSENQGLRNEIVELNKEKSNIKQQLLEKQQELENMKLRYDTTMENYLQQIGGKNKVPIPLICLP